MKSLIKKSFYITVILMLCENFVPFLFSNEVQRDIGTYLDTDIKPRILFHGSNNKNIKIIEPRFNHKFDEKPVIFATPHIGLASMFIMRWSDDNMLMGNFNWKSYDFVYKGSKESFIKNDVGGSIYFLSSDNFYFMKNVGLGIDEWLSVQPIEPFSKIDFNSSLDAMISCGVQVYFIENDILFEKLKKLIHGNEFNLACDILCNLKSENQLQNKNVLPIF